ncbi:hypothetical protein [Pseudotamlana carrageenivorans]|uniref:Polysaccharide biosynthesis protein n=1 Tax=Pseudotamlana carrageenivorans TaxID=2069432 RepID=A0A2I7SH51_9FLAO|nr:hypothetical protein [Tamlana carrageenivorans]AUS05221.1 hypothetical protein C1A40_06935 [Tamlana carrageenivorans]
MKSKGAIIGLRIKSKQSFMQKFYESNKDFIKKQAIFGVVFSFTKATVYLVPLLLADVLSSKDFGVLEYALAGLGMVVNTVINLGVPGAYPYFLLKEKRLDIQTSFKLHSIILLVPLIINQILFFCFQLNINFYLAFNVSFIIANQVFYSTQLKSHEKSLWAVILDSGIYLVLLLLFVLSFSGFVKININVISYFILFYALVYAVYAIYTFIKYRALIDFNKYKAILKFSIHLLISTFLIFLITTSGRILVEFFFDFNTVGIYAFYFRLAAVVVMIYQIINITFFKKIYTLNPNILDKYYCMFFVLIYTLSVFIFFVSPFVVKYFSNYFNETFVLNQGTYFLLSAQMVMWIASALNSSIIDREKLASKNNIKFLILIILSVVVLYFLRDIMHLQTLVLVHFTVITMACLIQYFSLYQKKIKFKKSIVSLLAIYAVSICVFIFII